MLRQFWYAPGVSAFVAQRMSDHSGYQWIQRDFEFIVGHDPHVGDVLVRAPVFRYVFRPIVEPDYLRKVAFVYELRGPVIAVATIKYLDDLLLMNPRLAARISGSTQH